MIMLDTNICIYVLKERPIKVLKTFEATDNIHISSIVYAELWSGIEKIPLKIKSERKEELLDFLSFIIILSWDQSAGLEYAKERARNNLGKLRNSQLRYSNIIPTL